MVEFPAHHVHGLELGQTTSVFFFFLGFFLFFLVSGVTGPTSRGTRSSAELNLEVPQSHGACWCVFDGLSTIDAKAPQSRAGLGRQTPALSLENPVHSNGDWLKFPVDAMIPVGRGSFD